jgi:hypothetical protein
MLLLGVGGVLLCLVHTIDHTTRLGFIAVPAGYFVAFVFIIVGAILASPRSSTVGTSFMIVGSVMWFVGWSWPWYLGMVVPVPFWVWAALAAAAYLVAAIAYIQRPDTAAGISSGLLFVGSLGSMIPPLLSPIFIPNYVYVPFGVGAVGAAVAVFIATRRTRAEALLPGELRTASSEAPGTAG